MDANALQRRGRRGERLLLDDIKILEGLDSRVPARERVEAALGAELAATLLSALTPRRRPPLGVRGA